MRIVLATDWWPPRIGGIESQVSDLAAMLASRGHAVRVLTTTRNPVALQGVEVERIDLPLIGHIAAPDPRRLRDIVERLVRARPDVVHAHGMFSSLASGSILAASRLRVPSVFSAHSMLRPWPVFLGGSVIFRLFSNRANILTGVSSATCADVKRASGRDVTRIPNGLHLAEGRVVRCDAPGVRIVSVTRLVPKKKPADVIRALRETVNSGRRLDVTLTIAGDGPERPALEAEARRLRVDHRVTFLGARTRPEIRELLATASILAHPGRLEAFGLALLEARAAGVPIVAMAAGGVPDLVNHRLHGLLAGSSREFHRAVAELAGDDGLRRRCAEAAPLDLDCFDWSQVVCGLEAAYARAVQLQRSC